MNRAQAITSVERLIGKRHHVGEWWLAFLYGGVVGCTAGMAITGWLFTRIIP